MKTSRDRLGKRRELAIALGLEGMDAVEGLFGSRVDEGIVDSGEKGLTKESE